VGLLQRVRRAGGWAARAGRDPDPRDPAGDRGPLRRGRRGAAAEPAGAGARRV